ncbi:uncharacterized protein KY384_004812 [Bacidia gigantensis]|uniref:uncharacterized protein n=1 Tax=Bacidia gigantensis TaxID=2732470 RepID=UPI001D04F1B7|nr:uncharacterized protein KY384_004812 [Bacidia gigantensis]KAG8530310.1 hypothetical protein KY384_004812 [Bacidia gigantensis]
MPSSLPTKFTDLYNTSCVSVGNYVDIMGVVTDYQQPIATRGTDWTCTFCLADRNYGRLGERGDEGLTVRCFNAPNDLPPIQGTGDVVIFRRVKVASHNGMKLVMTNKTSNWTIFPCASIPTKAPASGAVQIPSKKMIKAPPPTESEMLYAIEVCNLNERTLYTSTSSIASEQPSSTPSTDTNGHQTQRRGDRFSLIKDLDIDQRFPDKYVDLVGEVVKVYSQNDRVELYVTDYTSNKGLWRSNEQDGTGGAREGDEFGYLPRRSEKAKWPGPVGQLTLTVSLFPPHSYTAQNSITAGDFVFLRNVHIKWSKAAQIEGVMHTDQRFRDKLAIFRIGEDEYESDKRVRDIFHRKHEYKKKRKEAGHTSDSEQNGLKRKHVEDEKPLTKAQQKRKKKQQTEAARAALAAKQTNPNEHQTNSTEESKPTKTNGHPTISPSKDLNPNIRCSHPQYSTRPLSAIKSPDSSTHKNTTPAGTIYTLPFANIKSRATVRVIDFFPQTLEDFAVSIPKKPSEYTVLSDISSSSSSSSSDSDSDSNVSMRDADTPNTDKGKKYEWRFSLTLEDASSPTTKKGEVREKMEVFVVGADAEYLLKIDACDLRRDKERLGELREKLFLLWGDLEEGKRRREEEEDKWEGEGDGQVTPGRKVGDGKGKEGKGGGIKGVDNRPFQCCLKEYGVKVRKAKKNVDEKEVGVDEVKMDVDAEEDWNWERRWRLWGCTIV